MAFSRSIVNAFRSLLGRAPLPPPASGTVPNPNNPPPASGTVPNPNNPPPIPVKTPASPGIRTPSFGLPNVIPDPRFDDYQVRTTNKFIAETDAGKRYATALQQLEAFKAANPSPGTYSGNYANPELKAQYDRIYGEYQGATQPFFQGLEAARKQDPFVPIRRASGPRLGSNQDALAQLNPAQGPTQTYMYDEQSYTMPQKIV